MNYRYLPVVAGTIATLATAFATAVYAEPPADSGQFALTILHDNDLHGHILPFAYIETEKGKAEIPSVGGAARRATLVRKIRAQTTNPTILVDSGDTFTRGPLTNAYEGIADIEAMNAVGYEVAALGNNEFKAKDAVDQKDAAGAQAALLQIVKRSRFPWVCANAVDASGASLEGVQPYVVREYNGVRVGFLGLTAPRSASYPQTKGWTISDPIAAATRWIPEARKHCDILIALTHIGVDLDKELAGQTTGLDAIVGGDSHTFLYQPIVVSNPEGVNVPVVQDGEFGVRLGRFDLKFSRDASNHWHLTKYADKLLPVGATLVEARDVQAVVAPYVRPFQTVVGHIAPIADTPDGRTRQTTQIVVDALRQQTGADIALNPGTDSLFEVFRHPAVTRYEVYAALPFHNTVVTVPLTGPQIAAILQAHSGTVTSGDVTHLNPASTYTVACVDYVAHSAYNLAEAQSKSTDRDLREVVIAFLAHLAKGDSADK